MRDLFLKQTIAAKERIERKLDLSAFYGSTPGIMSQGDEFERAGYSGEMLEKMRGAYQYALTVNPRTTPGDIIDLALKVAQGTHWKMNANAVVYPQSADSAPPKPKKRNQRKKAKPKNRRVFR